MRIISREMLYRPVFIVGCSRSGTTLLGSMLGVADECIVTPESQFLIEAFRISRSFSDNKEGKSFNKIADFIVNHWRFKLWGLKDLNAELVKGTDVAEIMSCLITGYAKQQKKINTSVWIDHTPTHVKWILDIIKFFPNAKFIHIVRDGRAVMNSVKKLDWGLTSPQEISQWWAQQISLGFLAEQKVPDRIMRIKYEDLLYNSDQILKQVCNFLNLKYRSEMLSGVGFQKPSYTQKQHSLIGEKPKTANAEKWKKELSQRDIELFEYYSGNMIELLGYKSVFGMYANKPTKKELLYNFIKKDIRKAFDLVKNRYRRYKSI